MRLYHYTSRDNLDKILREGLKPGSEVEQGEQLPFVMLSKTQGDVRTGNVVHFEVEIADDDPKLRPVNDDWFEYYGGLPHWALMALANPPADTDALIELVQNFGTTSQEYKDAFRFVVIPKIYNSYEEIAVEGFEFDFYSTTPPVFRILVDKKHGSIGWWAWAMFRKNDMLDNLECHGYTAKEALNKLMAHLKSHYTEVSV